ncbi:MAG: hypothetical protein RMJ67_01155 [Elusimicrobiota bacterium]|nr:hypothetical protein [Endomicrobiia bacterium]MDW8165111.1 hypothetical protein [Elusimicrobiota bacterium]
MKIVGVRKTKKDYEKLREDIQRYGGENMVEKVSIPISDVIGSRTSTLKTKKKDKKTPAIPPEKTRKRVKSRVVQVGRKKRILTGPDLDEILSQRLPRIIIEYAKREMNRDPKSAKVKISSVIKAISGPGGIKLGRMRLVADTRSIKQGLKQYINSGLVDDKDDETKKVALMLLFGGKKNFNASYSDFVRSIMNRYGIELTNYNIPPSQVLNRISQELTIRLNEYRKERKTEMINKAKATRSARTQTRKELVSTLGISEYPDTSDYLSEDLALTLDDIIEEETDDYISEIADFVRGQGLPYDMLNAFLTGLVSVATIWTSSKLSEFTRDNIISRFMPNLDPKFSSSLTNIAIGFGLYNINSLLRVMRFQGELPPAVLTAFKIAGAIQIANGVWNFLTGRNILEITQQIDEIVSKAISNVIGQRHEEKQEVSSSTDEFRVIPASESFADLEEKKNVSSIVSFEDKNKLNIGDDILAYL